jgi:hypothetical protein
MRRLRGGWWRRLRKRIGGEGIVVREVRDEDWWRGSARERTCVNIHGEASEVKQAVMSVMIKADKAKTFKVEAVKIKAVKVKLMKPGEDMMMMLSSDVIV